MSRSLAFLAIAMVLVPLLQCGVQADQKFQLRPYPGSCVFFYSCASFDCPNGMVFDPNTSRCSPGGRALAPREVTALFPDDTDPKRYWECTRMPCPVGLEFNPVTLACDDPVTAGCSA